MNAPDSTHVHGEPATPHDWWDTLNCSGAMPYDSPTRHVFLLLVSQFSNGPGHERPLESIFPSVATIAAETGYGRSTVHRSLAALREDGWLIVTEAAGAGEQAATTYAAARPPIDPEYRKGRRRLTRGGVPQRDGGGPAAGRGGSRSGTQPTHLPTQRPDNPVSPRLRRAAEESAAGEASGSAAAEDEAQEPRAEDDQGDALEPGVTLTEADPIPSEVLDPLITAGNAGKSVPANIALYDAVAPLHGEKFADWLISDQVSLKAGMSRRDAGAKFRILANTAPKQGVPVFNPPAVRNTCQVDPTHPEVQRIRDQQRLSMAEAAERAAAAETAQPAVIEPDPEALAAAEHEQRRIAQQAAYDRAQAEARQKAARDARHAAWYRDNPSAAV